LPPEPLELVARWLAEAVQAAGQPNPNSMVLATVGAHGAPSARVVLCKEIRTQPGYVTFFTNYLSRKGRELSDHPRAAAVMHWDALGRQVRLEGQVTPTSAAESDAYFASRAWRSRLGAWASQQSQPIGSRAQLVQAYESAARRFGAPSPLTAEVEANPGAAAAIPRPPHWGGYRLWVDAVELWVEGTARLHDRARWQRSLTPTATPATPFAAEAPTATQTPLGFDTGPWSATRLQP
jgi:pyridoxamine 5'-phosphate oxidase